MQPEVKKCMLSVLQKMDDEDATVVRGLVEGGKTHQLGTMAVISSRLLLRVHCTCPAPGSNICFCDDSAQDRVIVSDAWCVTPRATTELP